MDLIQIAAQIYAALIANEERKLAGGQRPREVLADDALGAAEVFLRVSEKRDAAKALAALQASASEPAPLAKTVKRR